MEHRGEIIDGVLKELGVKKGNLAKRLKKHPNTITKWLQTADLPDTIVLEIGAALHYDFSHKITSLRRLVQAVNSTPPPAGEHVDFAPPFMVSSQLLPNTVADCHKALMEMQQQYIELLKNHVKVLSKLAHVA